MKIVNLEYLESKGFEKAGNGFGWAKFRKDGFELVEIPLKNGGYVFGFEYTYESQAQYKYPIRTNELEQLFNLLTGKEL